MSDLWYVAYGSNLSRPRFQRYLDAGPDRTPPTDARVVTLPHRLFFATESRVWTGGCAFLDPRTDPAVETHGRAWLITAEQFRSVLAQENGLTTVDVPDDVWRLQPGQPLTVLDRKYGLALGIASPDDRVALTFTTPASPLPDPNPPSAAYVDTIVAGLGDATGHALDDATARAYVTSAVTPPV